MQVGTRTAETLQGQGEQLGRVLDTLDEIHFSMKKAGQVIRDITRGVATDRCARPGSTRLHTYIYTCHVHKHGVQQDAPTRCGTGVDFLGFLCPCRCIQALLMVVIVAIVVIIACKSAGVGGKNTIIPLPSLGVRKNLLG